MQERWKVIKDWPKYSVSNLGQIINTQKNKRIKPFVDQNGYHKVNLERNGVRKKVSVRRLVAFAFVSGYFEGAFIRDRDNNKLNNQFSNLFWATTQNLKNNTGPKRLSEKWMSVEEFEKRYFDPITGERIR